MNYVYAGTLIGNIITFVIGTSLTWPSPVLIKLHNSTSTIFAEPTTTAQEAWIATLLPLGTACGPFLFTYLADLVGRKTSLLCLGIPYALMFIVLAFGRALWVYLAARFVQGLLMGGVFSVMPMYVGEIADVTNRGALTSLMNAYISFGMLFSYSVGPFVSIVLFNLILAIFPAVFFVLYFFLTLETPYYYVSKNRNEEARNILEKLRGTDNIHQELEAIQNEQKDNIKGNLLVIFKTKRLRRAFLITTGLVVFQQFSGIDAIQFYTQSIFKEANTSLPSEYCAIIVAVIQFLAGFIAPLLSDRLGRKILLIVSAIGMFLSEVPIGVYCYLQDHGTDVTSLSILPIIFLILYIVFFHLGFGPLPWAILAELFPKYVKVAAASFTASLAFLLSFLITFFFPMIRESLGLGPAFWIFAGSCALALPFSISVVIETKGKTFEEIQKELDG